MSTLRQYHNGEFEIDSNDFIFIDKFESLFNVLHDGNKILKFSPIRENTKDELLEIFELAKGRDKITILSLNPDTDMPCIKKEYLLQDNIPYTEEKQRQLESLSLDYFLDGSIFDNAHRDLQMYCHSVIKKTPNLNMIPLGRDPKGKSVSSSGEFNMVGKEILCYYNCSVPPLSIHWYGRIRSYIYEGLQNSSFVKMEHVGLNQNRDLCESTFYNYYETISKSKFMICPRGCGLDTYRLWDCLYLGCIPIIVKYEGYQDFEDLPILFVEKWEDYLALTEDYLNQKYSEMIDKIYNYDKLKFSWWENLISSDLSGSII